LKTIRKLGFVVAAVWNGKEALEYLLATDSSNPPHPKPDIILMDVQMPIIDGYRATHLIRHHAPYNVSARNIPIVAMTASAIQGDREKCMQAGMDDYLAKPVKGKALEKMLVHWAVSKRTLPTGDAINADGWSECSESAEHDCSAARVLMSGDSSSSVPASSEPQKHEQSVPPRPTTLERQNSRRLVLPGPESEGDRADMRNEAEEKAIRLRDDKLVEAAGGGGYGSGTMHTFALTHVPGRTPEEAGQRLTVENVGRLELEAEAVKSKSGASDLRRGTGGVGRSPEERDSVGAENGSGYSDVDGEGGKINSIPNVTVDGERPPSSSEERARLGMIWRNSDMTVTGP
jgi:CheY-like chemotaxis protein